MDTKRETKLIHLYLSYVLTGICFAAHNELGQFAKEKQYGDVIEKKLKEIGINFEQGCAIGSVGDIVDFLIDNKIILELKAKRVLTKEDYRQTKNYIHESGVRLALLVNFRNKYMKPIKIVRVDH